MKAEDVAEWHERRGKVLKAMDGHETVNGDYAAAIRAVIEERERLRVALTMFRNYGCPVCHGDCAAANPPVLSCPMQIARTALEPKP